jgi:hypothetical protein
MSDCKHINTEVIMGTTLFDNLPAFVTALYDLFDKYSPGETFDRTICDMGANGIRLSDGVLVLRVALYGTERTKRKPTATSEHSVHLLIRPDADPVPLLSLSRNDLRRLIAEAYTTHHIDTDELATIFGVSVKYIEEAIAA